MGVGTPDVITIPSIMVSQSDGALIRSTQSTDTVNATMKRNPSDASVRWLVSEDSTGFGGAIRDMWDPTCFGDPDRANSQFQMCDAPDNGGVHSGSGIPNHAFAMLVDGKTFNGYTVSGIGPIKAGAVWYRAGAVYLTPASNFQDAYVALNQAAADLIGTTIIDPRDGVNTVLFTAADAVEVDDALRAVEMNTRGPCGECVFDSGCDDGLYCNGLETCVEGVCEPGTDLCVGQWCDESSVTCYDFGNGDFDLDADVDLADFAAFQECFGQYALPSCGPGNMSGDGYIGLTDYDAFEGVMTGP
jgi:hypothetical protein